MQKYTERSLFSALECNPGSKLMSGQHENCSFASVGLTIGQVWQGCYYVSSFASTGSKLPHRWIQRANIAIRSRQWANIALLTWNVQYFSPKALHMALQTIWKLSCVLRSFGVFFCMTLKSYQVNSTAVVQIRFLALFLSGASRLWPALQPRGLVRKDSNVWETTATWWFH